MLNIDSARDKQKKKEKSHKHNVIAILVAIVAPSATNVNKRKRREGARLELEPQSLSLPLKSKGGQMLRLQRLWIAISILIKDNDIIKNVLSFYSCMIIRFFFSPSFYTLRLHIGCGTNT